MALSLILAELILRLAKFTVAAAIESFWHFGVRAVVPFIGGRLKGCNAQGGVDWSLCLTSDLMSVSHDSANRPLTSVILMTAKSRVLYAATNAP